MRWTVQGVNLEKRNIMAVRGKAPIRPIQRALNSRARIGKMMQLP